MASNSFLPLTVPYQSALEYPLNEGVMIFFPRESYLTHFLLPTCSAPLYCFRRKTGWANQQTTVPGVQEVTSDQIPADAVERIQKVNAVMMQLTGAGLIQTPAMALASASGVAAPMAAAANAAQPGATAASASGIAQVANVAEAALDAAMGVPAPAASAAAVPMAGLAAPPAPPTAAAEAAALPAASAPDPKQVGGADAPTATILVHNMFDKDEETEEGWEEDIRLDFEDESSKHGKLRKVVVMHKEPGGKIYAAFEMVEGATKCAQNLAGRWFDKRQLRVEFVADDTLPGQ
mmetsp:Transcript_36147/g.108172  ORF Transcript_36147/g.108172 Transcript_36147/m.108172 type:complete len:292 (-) Transcript_36147:197-1072(-)